MSESIITLDKVFWAYARSADWALKNISLDIGEGDFIAVMGENESGKTTLCRLLNGLIPHALAGKLLGTVTVGGVSTAASTIPRLAEKVGMSFDDPETQLFTATVYDEAAFALENLLLPPAEIRERAEWALHACGLWDYAGYQPASLSGGQKQRLAIAAALAMAEKILVLDEPCSQLDPAGVQEVLSLIASLRSRRLTVVMTTASGGEAAEFADKICVLEKGCLAAFDTPQRIFAGRKLLAGGGIQYPQAAEFAHRMESLGEPLPQFPVNPDEAEQSVLQWYSNG